MSRKTLIKRFVIFLAEVLFAIMYHVWKVLIIGLRLCIIFLILDHITVDFMWFVYWIFKCQLCLGQIEPIKLGWQLLHLPEEVSLGICGFSSCTYLKHFITIYNFFCLLKRSCPKINFISFMVNELQIHRILYGATL